MRSDMTNETINVLVTGGGGFLGSHILRYLLSAKPEWKIYSASRNPKGHADQQEGVEYLSCDLANEEQVNNVFDQAKPKVVFHPASPDRHASRSALESGNVQGTKLLLKAAAECASTRVFVFTSSDSALAPQQEPISEDEAVLYDLNNYSNPYGLTKAIAEILTIAANSPELLTTAIRIPGLYGEFDYGNFLPALVAAIKKGEHKVQIGANEQPSEYLYVRKAAEAHVLAADALLTEDAKAEGAAKVAGEAFFISDGINHRYWDFYRKCFAAGGAPVDPKEIRKIPLGVAQAMASTLEWTYAIFTLGSMKPAMKRQDMDHFLRGNQWKLDKAKARLGYIPFTQEEQDAAVKRMMDWGFANLTQ